MTTQPLPPNWYPDPSGKPGLAYWDGQQWHAEVPDAASPANPPRAEGFSAKPQRQRPSPLFIGVCVVVAIFIAGVAVTGYLVVNNSQRSTSAGPPVAETVLAGLLLSTDQINSAMGISGMTVQATFSTLPKSGAAKLSDQACMPVAGVADIEVYANSGWTAAHGQGLNVADVTKPSHFVEQFVVLFPSAKDAGAFFTASAQRWPACANHQFTVTIPGLTATEENVGPISNENGTLSATITGGSGTTTSVVCQRALTVANNVAVDIQACNVAPSDATAVKIAHQIATKVPK